MITASHQRQSSNKRITFRPGKCQPHCADAIAQGITFAGSAIQRKTHTKNVNQL